MRHQGLVVLATATLVLSGCRGLPSNYDSLPLEQKVAAYEKHLRRGGHSLAEGRDHISLEGYPAAEVMTDYLEGKRKGFPASEALMIIWQVQTRGCDLAGTRAERAVEQLAQDKELGFAAGLALESIREHRYMKPGQLTHVIGGPCEKAAAARAAREEGNGPPT
jgi:hypothetical protein